MGGAGIFEIQNSHTSHEIHWKQINFLTLLFKFMIQKFFRFDPLHFSTCGWMCLFPVNRKITYKIFVLFLMVD